MLRRIILPLLCLALLLPACKEEPKIPAELKAINEAIESDKPGIYYMLRYMPVLAMPSGDWTITSRLWTHLLRKAMKS